MLQYDFEQSLTYWICSTAHALERALNEELAPHGITYRQWQVLAWLALDQEPTQSELAERMRIEAPTLAGILDRMERDGWIERTCCPWDRRKKRVAPTARVAPVWETVAKAARRVRSRAAEGFEPAQIETLLDMLRAIQANVAAVAREGDSKTEPGEGDAPCGPAKSRR